jgi:hypothetical protein
MAIASSVKEGSVLKSPEGDILIVKKMTKGIPRARGMSYNWDLECLRFNFKENAVSPVPERVTLAAHRGYLIVHGWYTFRPSSMKWGKLVSPDLNSKDEDHLVGGSDMQDAIQTLLRTA